MARRAVAMAACAASALAAGLVGGAPARAASSSPGAWHVVRAGESVQAAVDAARPGDTVLLLPGVYQGGIQLRTSDVTLRGTGAGLTVIRPAAAQTAASGSAPDAGAPAPTTAAGCAAAGDGVCVTGASGVHITDLAVTGFAAYGIRAAKADALTVSGVRADDNGLYGIGQEQSVRSRFTGNRAAGNGEAGLFVANTVSEEAGATDTQGTEVSGNTLTGNHMGLVVRRLRDVTVARNTLSGNCAGAFLVGDENTPRAGELTVRDNTVTANNAYCAANAHLPFVQGAGIVLTGIENTELTGNTVTDNVGTSPLSGGIVLFPSFVGAPNSGNTVRDNTVLRNGPADLADSDHGTGNTFTGNDCRVSLPAGRC
ncbi:right-handed parallel beta-helix repeat-containing protein [Actinacidiphila guanduensis]|uniref:Nitrous oxidase accessory protein NosD, contains tandem CASH domains n=1 Tax=Actinacidiphila guanduensis TaxID=310781 RepID=A0A1H0GGK7_9ACTN|nr:right-handed parallel beta-helix repeat-containing protein [Actinacidiphila guanduensis]SDO06055.1 Nitrous oxidase accessory protein NosD, contains tandem CASH domains [Actinacidiphila guanduensis]